MCEGQVQLNNAAVFSNMVLSPEDGGSRLPAQIACEYMEDGPTVLNFNGATISGNPSTDIGIYSFDSDTPITTTTIFGSLAADIVEDY